MTTKKARIVTGEDVATWGVMWPTFSGPVMTMDGPDNYECGNCGKKLANQIDNTRFINLAIRCFDCGAVNAISSRRS